jgi:hypothetical protein
LQVSICRLELKCALALPYIFRFPNSAFQMARKGNGGFVPFTGSGHKLSESPDKEVHVVKEAETHDAKTKRMKLTGDQTLGAEPTPEVTPSFGNPKHQPEPKPESSQPEPIQLIDDDDHVGMPYDEEQLGELMDMKTMTASWLYRIPDVRYARDIRFDINELIGDLTLAISCMDDGVNRPSSSSYSPWSVQAWVSSATMDAFVVRFANVKKVAQGMLDPDAGDEDNDEEAHTSEPEAESVGQPTPPAKRRKGDANPLD